MPTQPAKAPPAQEPALVPLGTVFWPYPTADVRDPHPYFVIAGPVEGRVLAVNITDLEAFEHKVESTCVLRKGDHECITKDSAVNFLPNKPAELPIANMPRILAEGKIVRHYGNLTPELLEHVRQGARDSQEMCPRLKAKYGLKTAK